MGEPRVCSKKELACVASRPNGNKPARVRERVTKEGGENKRSKEEVVLRSGPHMERRRTHLSPELGFGKR